jgi:hypothetical protein
MGFHVTANDVDTLAASIDTYFGNVGQELKNVQTAAQQAVHCDLSGQAADTLKAYYQDVHVVLTGAITTTISYIRTCYMLFVQGVGRIDSSADAIFDEDTLNQAYKKLDGYAQDEQDTRNQANLILSSISDLTNIAGPRNHHQDYLNDAKIAKDVVDSMNKLDAAQKGPLQKIEKKIDDLNAFIAKYMNTAVSGASFSPEKMANDSTFAAIVADTKDSTDFVKVNGAAVDATEQAIAQRKQVRVDEAAEKAKAAERTRNGLTEIISTLIGATITVAVAAGAVAATVATGGTALAIIIPAATAVTLAMDTADIVDGAQDIAGGMSGDAEGKSWKDYMPESVSLLYDAGEVVANAASGGASVAAKEGTSVVIETAKEAAKGGAALGAGIAVGAATDGVTKDEQWGKWGENLTESSGEVVLDLAQNVIKSFKPIK